ncbi:MAG: YggT family protein, partial [Gaiellales bacterium]|nr:YggT family protein [Gaiellales bacterium]
MIDTVIRFVDALFYVYLILIFVFILLSWVQLPYNIWVGRVRNFLHDTVEPYLRLFRRLIPPFGGLDLSPMLGIIVLYL